MQYDIVRALTLHSISFETNDIFFLRMFTKYPIEKMFFTCAFKSFLTPATVFFI